MGVEYSPKDMLLGLDEASSNQIGSPVDNILTYCYHYDPTTNTHDLIISRVVQIGGLFTILILGGFMLVMFRRDYRHPDAIGIGPAWDTKEGERIKEWTISAQYFGNFSTNG